MTPFLKQVAQVYATHHKDGLDNLCFIFPNKRSATFFLHYLSECFPRKALIMPEITNISDFTTTISGLTKANRYDLLFTLFDEYRQLPGVIESDFDKFLFWGEMILSDFDDVDRHLVDADALFKNIYNYREISSTYLTDTQLDIIRRYWGEERTPEPVDRFWKHIGKSAENSSEHPNQARFVKLWEVLGPLYHNFRNRLTENSLASSGMIMRRALEVIQSPEFSPKFSTYIFVGFNALSTAEIKIFSTLQKKGLADFYWDSIAPEFNIPQNQAMRFVRHNQREFPSRYPLEPTSPHHFPNIKIQAIPSAIGQVKQTASQLSTWIENKDIPNASNAINTAIVLPDESLFVPLIHSVPEKITPINVTMGLPMKFNPMASLISAILSLQLRSRISKGKPSFYAADVSDLLSNNTLRQIDPDGIARLEATITARRLFNVPASLITDIVPSLEIIFTPIINVGSTNQDTIYNYIRSICDLLGSITADKEQEFSHSFVESYQNAALSLYQATRKFNITMQPVSFLKLLQRAIASDTVRFKGEPLKGLQIMGVLETRALDFDNIVMMSMNERTFPRRHYSSSFIPDALRHGYGMSTADFQESIYAYYFYRLISRAKNVTLLYDARSSAGTKSNEPSRYIAQLLYFHNANNRISHLQGVYTPQKFTGAPPTVHKTEEVMAKLNKFKAGEGKANLSASAINHYIDCPMYFYLSNVEGFNAEDDVIDYMDSSTYGTVLHDVAQHLYQSFQPADDNGVLQPVLITKSMLQPFTKADNLQLQRLVTAAINTNYNKLPQEKQYTPLDGQNMVMGKIICTIIANMISLDIQKCPFTFYGAEFNMVGQLNISNDLIINVRQIVDRIDTTRDDIKRFVDYKSGDDKSEASSIEALFSEGKSDPRPKAILQLLFYCLINKELNNDDQPVQPVIYQFTKMMDGTQPEPVSINKIPITDYHVHLNEFKQRLYSTIEEIFNPNVPFEAPAEGSQLCKFCQFKALCSREDEN